MNLKLGKENMAYSLNVLLLHHFYKSEVVSKQYQKTIPLYHTSNTDLTYLKLLLVVKETIISNDKTSEPGSTVETTLPPKKTFQHVSPNKGYFSFQPLKLHFNCPLNLLNT